MQIIFKKHTGGICAAHELKGGNHMKFIEKLTNDYINGKFDNGVNVKSRFTASGINWTYETIDNNGKAHFYTSVIQATNAHNTIDLFFKLHGVNLIEK